MKKWTAILALAFVLAATATTTGAQPSAQNFYPPEAKDKEIEGQATIDCIIQADFTVKQCVVVDEQPRGWGFGKATIEVFEKYAKMKPDVPGQPTTVGMHKKFTFQWRLG